MPAPREIPVGVLKDPKVAIALARRRYARLAGSFEKGGRTIAWWREYLIVQQTIGVLVIDCMAHTSKIISTPGDFDSWQKTAGGNP
jgi:hypothetical protein